MSGIMLRPRWWNYNYSVLLITWAGWISIYLARSVLPPLLPVIRQEFGINHTQSGLLETAYLIGYIVVKIPAGLLASRYGSKRVLAASMVGYGISNLLISGAGSFFEIFVLRLLVGLFQGVHLPVANALLSDRFGERQGRAIGFNESGPNIGNTVAFPLTVSILSLFGWRYAFILLSLPAFILSLATILVMKPEKAIPGNVKVEQRDGGLQQYARLLLPFALSHGIYNLLLRTTFTFTPSFLVEFRNIPVEAAGVISMVLPFAGIFAKVSSGFILEKIGRKTAICGASALSAVFLSALVSFPFHDALLLNLMALGLTLYSFSPIIYSSTTASLPSRHKSMGLGIVTMFGNIIGAASTSVVGALIDSRGFPFAFYVISAVALSSSLAAYVLMDN